MAVTGFTAGMGMTGDAEARVDAPLRSSAVNPADGGYIDPRKVLLYECTRREIRERLENGELKAAIIPTGATEQHNEHLAMIMDTAGSLLMSQQAALQLYPQVIVSTPVPIGISAHWMDRKGTLNLRKEVFIDVVYDICDSLTTHGIKTILIVNGHGGNVGALREAMPEFRSKLGITVDMCSYWDSISRDLGKKLMESGDWPGHASEFETSIALAAFPERLHYRGVDPTIWDRVRYTGVSNTEDDKGKFEFSKLASAEKGEFIITHASRWIVDKLRTMIE